MHFSTIARRLAQNCDRSLTSALDAGYIAETTFGGLHAQAERVARVTPGFRASITRALAQRNGPAASMADLPSLPVARCPLLAAGLRGIMRARRPACFHRWTTT